MLMETTQKMYFLETFIINYYYYYHYYYYYYHIIIIIVIVHLVTVDKKAVSHK